MMSMSHEGVPHDPQDLDAFQNSLNHALGNHDLNALTRLLTWAKTNLPVSPRFLHELSEPAMALSFVHQHDDLFDACAQLCLPSLFNKAGDSIMDVLIDVLDQHQLTLPYHWIEKGNRVFEKSPLYFIWVNEMIGHVIHSSHPQAPQEALSMIDQVHQADMVDHLNLSHILLFAMSSPHDHLLEKIHGKIQELEPECLDHSVMWRRVRMDLMTNPVHAPALPVYCVFFDLQDPQLCQMILDCMHNDHTHPACRSLFPHLSRPEVIFEHLNKSHPAYDHLFTLPHAVALLDEWFGVCPNKDQLLEWPWLKAMESHATPNMLRHHLQKHITSNLAPSRPPKKM